MCFIRTYKVRCWGYAHIRHTHTDSCPRNVSLSRWAVLLKRGDAEEGGLSSSLASLTCLLYLSSVFWPLWSSTVSLPCLMWAQPLVTNQDPCQSDKRVQWPQSQVLNCLDPYQPLRSENNRCICLYSSHLRHFSYSRHQIAFQWI